MKLTLKDKMPFGKWKGAIIENIIPKDDDNYEGYSLFGRGDGLNYLKWAIKEWKNVEFSDGIKIRIREIEKIRLQNYKPEPQRYKGRSYDHYNDMGWTNDMTFQDVYGDFGY